MAVEEDGMEKDIEELIRQGINNSYTIGYKECIRDVQLMHDFLEPHIGTVEGAEESVLTLKVLLKSLREKADK